jgi:hypothetical protein
MAFTVSYRSEAVGQLFKSVFIFPRNDPFLAKLHLIFSKMRRSEILQQNLSRSYTYFLLLLPAITVGKKYRKFYFEIGPFSHFVSVGTSRWGGGITLSFWVYRVECKRY